MPAIQMVIDAVVQLLVFSLLCTVCWLGHKGISKIRQKQPTGLFEWLGVIKPSASFKDAAVVVAGLLLFGAVMTLAESGLGLDSLAAIQENSPGAKAARMPNLGMSLVAGFAYAFIMTGAAEELVMRGLLYKRFLGWFGYFPANLLQALIFAGLHNVIIQLGSEDPPLAMHLIIFTHLFVFSYVLGWYMEKKDGGSLFVPWLCHGLMNFKTVFIYMLFV